MHTFVLRAPWELRALVVLKMRVTNQIRCAIWSRSPKLIFQSVFEAIRQNEILKFLEKSAFFNEENTNELDPMLKSGKIHLFSI